MNTGAKEEDVLDPEFMDAPDLTIIFFLFFLFFYFIQVFDPVIQNSVVQQRGTQPWTLGIIHLAFLAFFKISLLLELNRLLPSQTDGGAVQSTVRLTSLFAIVWLRMRSRDPETFYKMLRNAVYNI